jgi:exopolysaccharide biosynthesis polyprenyl glycosylphosphotransferase
VSPTVAFAALPHAGERRREAALGMRERRRRSLTRLLAVGDAAGVIVAAVAAAAIAGAVTTGDVRAAVAAYALVVGFVWFALAALHGFYRHGERRPDGPVTDGLVTAYELAAVASWVAFAPFAAVSSWHVPISAPFAFWLLAPPLVLLSQLVVCRVVTTELDRAQRAVIVGAGEVGELLARKIFAHPEAGFRVVGFVDESPRRATNRPTDDLELPVIGTTEELEELVDEYDVDRVLIAFSLHGHEHLLSVARRLAERGVAVDVVPRLFEVIGPTVKVWSIEGLPLFGIPSLRLSRGSLAVKRAFDIVASAILLFLVLPVLVLIAIAIKLESGSPILFQQERIGENSRPFTIFKFRSMYDSADDLKPRVAHLNVYASRGDPRMFKVENDPRVTRFGRYIRRYFLDELPQLLNVLRGEMSLVGPRPLIPEEDMHVVAWQRSRLALKPGITGPWQVLGGNDIPFDEMVKLDYLYVTGWTLGTDIRLLLQTCSAVARRRALL